MTFYVHPDYRADSRLLHYITRELIQKRYGQTPAQDPALEELLLKLAGNEDIENRLATLRDVGLSAVGRVIREPLAARGQPDARADMLERIGDTVKTQKDEHAEPQAQKKAKAKGRERGKGEDAHQLRLDSQPEHVVDDRDV